MSKKYINTLGFYGYRENINYKSLKETFMKNLYSLGLLRNGKVFSTKEEAIQGLIEVGTNDGVAKLARYLYTPANSNESIIKTIVGFYANADEMEDNGGGASYYTIFDIDADSSDVHALSGAIDTINEIIGDGIPNTTLTDAINEVNATIGTGFTTAYTIADALTAIGTELTNRLTVSLEEASTPTTGYAKTYVLSQGTGTGKTQIGTIDIPNGSGLVAGSGISIVSDVISSVAAEYSDTNVENPITVDGNGIKFDSTLDCGFFDSNPTP